MRDDAGQAAKLSACGRVVLRVEAGEALAGALRRVREGLGIAPEHLAQLFEPSEQMSAVRKRADGAGLGLTISKRIVELMGGAIRVESRLGHGSMFEVELPLVEVSASPAAHEPEPWERVTGYEGPRRAVLVVDDEADNRAVARHLLVPLGFDVAEASCGGKR